MRHYPRCIAKKAVAQNVKTVTTLDALSKCPGVAHNAGVLAALGENFYTVLKLRIRTFPGYRCAGAYLYEHMTKMQAIDVLRSATAKSGQYLNIRCWVPYNPAHRPI